MSLIPPLARHGLTRLNVTRPPPSEIARKKAKRLPHFYTPSEIDKLLYWEKEAAKILPQKLRGMTCVQLTCYYNQYYSETTKKSYSVAWSTIVSYCCCRGERRKRDILAVILEENQSSDVKKES